MVRSCLFIVMLLLQGCLPILNGRGDFGPPRLFFIAGDRPEEAGQQPDRAERIINMRSFSIEAFLNIENIVVLNSKGQVRYFKQSSWSDRPTKVMMSAIKKKIEAALPGYYVAYPGYSLGKGDSLQGDVHAFYFDEVSSSVIISAKLLYVPYAPEKESSLRAIYITRPTSSNKDTAIAEAMREALAEFSDETVDWVREIQPSSSK